MSEASELREACAEAARRGGAVLRERFGASRTIEYKGGIDLVTDADRASEGVLLDFIHERFPGAAVLAEESGISGGAHVPAALRFIVDPLDGTTNYAHGLPHFAVNVAVERAGRLLAAATLDPLRDELFLAAAGEGATLNGERITVSRAHELMRSLLCTGFPYDIHEEHDLPLRFFGAFLSQARAIRRLGSAAIDLAYLACGRFDGFWEMKLKPWDLAAGMLLVREAGGVATDLDGGDRIFETGGIVAANPGLHGLMLDVLRASRTSAPA
ncbi:MAG TPA: inositol monophosphatase family protein [Anaeromyxobacteraceae bacterium]|nr:inositol monophosphatase family protein [Anaeromyxobacteraceae bacterium]